MNEKRNGLIGGLILIIIGLFALVAQFVDLSAFGNIGLYFMAGLGAIFLLWGIVSREAGLIIPGGILSGLGWGIVLAAGPLGDRFNASEGGLFMLAFAGGWFAITLLTAIFTEETHWWALIPGSIMALVGLAVAYEGVFMAALELLGTIWPIFLIIAGIAVLFSVRRGKDDADEKAPKEALQE